MQGEQDERVDHTPNAKFGGQLGAQVERALVNSGRGIGWAIKQMWNGQAVCRHGWNGRNMYVRLQVPDANSKMTQPYVFMRTADHQLVPWLCSQTDLLAMDWDFYQERG